MTPVPYFTTVKFTPHMALVTSSRRSVSEGAILDEASPAPLRPGGADVVAGEVIPTKLDRSSPRPLLRPTAAEAHRTTTLARFPQPA
jgi:hypothetical protein